MVNRGDADYDPLFAYGYGLTYGDDVEVGELAEEGRMSVPEGRTVYFDRGPVAPWRYLAPLPGSVRSVLVSARPLPALSL